MPTGSVPTDGKLHPTDGFFLLPRKTETRFQEMRAKLADLQCHS